MISSAGWWLLEKGLLVPSNRISRDPRTLPAGPAENPGSHRRSAVNAPAIHLPAPGGQCPHLGIKNDPATAVAFPSTWNYCHRASPSASVALAHQRRYCQGTVHVQCAVFQAARIGPLPPDIRARKPPTPQRRHAWVLLAASLATVALVVSALWFRGVPPLLRGSASQALYDVPPGTPTATLELPSPAGMAVPGTVVPAIPAVTARATVPWALLSTAVVLGPSTSTSLPDPTRVDACGHDLDEEFGLGRKFIIHRVQSGESIDMFAKTHGTDLATLQGVNAKPLSPLLPGQIIVIPLNQRSTDAVPRFDAYQLSERTTKYAKITVLLGVPNLDEFLLYNGFVTKCPYFSGWVLAPRGQPSPQPTQICFASDAQSAVICYPTATPTKHVLREP